MSVPEPVAVIDDKTIPFSRPSEEPTRQGIFLYQFEALCRHRLGYDRGLEAVAGDPAFDETWREWILKLVAHNRNENRLVQTAMNLEVGTGD